MIHCIEAENTIVVTIENFDSARSQAMQMEKTIKNCQGEARLEFNPVDGDVC